MRWLSRNARARRLVVSSLVGFGVAAVLAVGVFAEALDALRARMGDIFFLIRPPQVARATVVVGIDQRSYHALLDANGPLSSWPRTIYARAIDRLHAAGARVIALAIFFDAPRPEDPELAEVMRRAGNVVMPVVAQGPLAFDPRPGVAQEFAVFVRPTATLRAAAAAEGLANITTAGDSVVRGLPLVLRVGEEQVPSLALTVVAEFTRRPAIFDAPPGAGVVHAAGRAIPVGERNTLAINFLGPPSGAEGGGPFRILSFVDVLEGRFDAREVRDRVVLLGPTIRGVDEHPTPTAGRTRMGGVEVLGNAVETILFQRWLVPVPWPATVGLVVALALLAALAVAAWRPLAAGAVGLALLATYVMAAAACFEAGIVLDPLYPPLALLVTFAAALAYRVVFEEAQHRVVRGAMARYLSPAVSRWVLADPARIRLGGELREMTVLFCDLRNFTSVTHALGPETVVALLNTYRAAMADIVFAHDGVLAQFAGDAFEAFWNAPMNQSDHAERACGTALDMVRALERLRPEFARRGWPELEIGVGINTGPMVVGNMGSRSRLEYTAVGDAVNVAARLEGLSKEYGTRIVVGEATRAAARGAFVYRFLDVVAVKGRAAPLTVYEVVGREGQVPEDTLEWLERFHEGIQLYRGRRWTAAAACFEGLAVASPADGPTRLYRRRAIEFCDHPPPPDWDGVYVVATK
jgi:adenylate cyclase